MVSINEFVFVKSKITTVASQGFPNIADLVKQKNSLEINNERNIKQQNIQANAMSK